MTNNYGPAKAYDNQVFVKFSDQEESTREPVATVVRQKDYDGPGRGIISIPSETHPGRNVILRGEDLRVLRDLLEELPAASFEPEPEPWIDGDIVDFRSNVFSSRYVRINNAWIRVWTDDQAQRRRVGFPANAGDVMAIEALTGERFAVRRNGKNLEG